MKPLSGVEINLIFTCAHEEIPAPQPDTDLLFQYARWMQKNNQLKKVKAVSLEVERLYRISSENGHFKANINLQNGAMRGDFELRGDEYLRLSQQLIEAKVATGYYFVAIFLQQGAAGLRMDPEMAMRYYRKAADEGSAQAQYYVADKLAPRDIAPDIARQMYRCAATQGNGRAAVFAGMERRDTENYQEALEFFQMAAAAGYSSAASRLVKAFRTTEPDGRVYYLGQREDLERADRYKSIWRVLSNYSYAAPSVPEINEIVPLPPATLPPWDGKLQWLETRLANVPPEKPSEVLIHQLAKAKVLDPATGKPMPGSPAFSDANFPVMTCVSGEVCPQTGYWKIILTSWTEHIRYFEEGDVMPRHLMTWPEPRLWPLRDKIVQREERVRWGLLG
ncbi:SEL1-like repeat protein [Pseudomonas reidholzensis]|uniref:SEL1-like repeat protein n=1 Tax=Pseudomonas reidholzensis TaxID=1785162 RepID=UPI0031345F88